MARLILWNLVSLDGFYAGPGDDIGWHMDYWSSDMEALSNQQLESMGALLFGRRTYEMMASYWPTSEPGAIADHMNAMPKVVFSRTLDAVTWSNSTLYRDNPAERVAELKRTAEKDIYLFGSGNLAASLLPHGLFDELRIGVAPFLLGDGLRLFPKLEERKQFSLLEASTWANGVVFTRYGA